MLRLSLTQEEELEKAEERQRRIERLKQVRKQSDRKALTNPYVQVRDQQKRLSGRKAQKYQQTSAQEWSGFLKEQKTESEHLLDIKRQALLKLLDQRSLEYGLAQAMAADLSNQKELQSHELRIKASHEQAVEAQRSNAAIALSHEQRRLLEEEREYTINMLKEAREKEDLRAKRIAELYQQSQRNSAQPFELLSQPLQSITRLQRTLGGDTIKFEQSRYHREFAVVRAAVDERANKNVVTVESAAASAAEEAIRRRKQREEVLAKQNEEAVARHLRAVEELEMDKKRDKLTEHLEKLQLLDRRRKHHNAAQYAATHRMDFIATGPATLLSQFNRKFKTDETPFDNERATNLASTRIGDRSEYEEDSVEFTRFG
ncbi:hypothetical protein HDU76_013130 [Blyttiomyces sp. JEL0837]|nr:hypothetical protein HDU76_013130 [Blyttiomyces sp. JEL0837]